MAAPTTSVRQDSDGGLTVEQLLAEARDVSGSDLGRARSLVQQARVLARTAHDVAGESEALYRLAELSYGNGMNNEAFAIALEARGLAHQCAAAMTEVSALNLIAAVQYHAANYSEALASATSALDLYRSTGERTSEGMLLNSLAVIQHSLSDTDRAIVTYEAALMANKGQDRPDLDAITLANMAKVRADRNEDLLAVSLGESALELATDHAPEFVPEILARLAIAYVALFALDRATACLDQADGVLRDRTARRVALSPGSVVTVHIARGELYVAQHLRDHALREWGEALELAMQADMTEVALSLREKLATLNKDMGRFEQALVHQEAKYILHEEIFNRGTDLRIKTLQIQHDTENARHQAEMLRLRTSELDQMVAARTDDIERRTADALHRVAMLADNYNDDGRMHPERVGELSAAIARELGDSDDAVERLHLAARLHDIGKLTVPQDILYKPGPLTAIEFEAIKTHVAGGVRLLGTGTSPLLDLAAEIALHHHERWDGKGYPAGLRGVSIPRSARIVIIADVYDALVSERCYKQAWSAVDAMQYVLAGAGSQFDAEMVEAFLSVMTRRQPSLAALLDRSTPA